MGFEIADGGIGIDLGSELILIYSTINLDQGDASNLANFITVFVSAVEKLRDECEDICNSHENVQTNQYSIGQSGLSIFAVSESEQEQTDETYSDKTEVKKTNIPEFK